MKATGVCHVISFHLMPQPCKLVLIPLPATLPTMSSELKELKEVLGWCTTALHRMQERMTATSTSAPSSKGAKLATTFYLHRRSRNLPGLSSMGKAQMVESAEELGLGSKRFLQLKEVGELTSMFRSFDSKELERIQRLRPGMDVLSASSKINAEMDPAAMETPRLLLTG